MLEAEVRPHRAVELSMRCSGPLAPTRVLKTPKRLPKDTPIGPASHAGAEPFLDEAGANLQDGKLNQAAESWFAGAEREVRAALHVDRDPDSADHLGRGGGASFVWAAPKAMHHGGRPKTSAKARSLFWAADRLRELGSRHPLASGTVRMRHAVEKWAFAAPTPHWAALTRVEGWVKDDLKEVADALCKEAEGEQHTFLKDKRWAVRKWAQDSAAKGAKAAHAFVKQSLGWRPDPAPHGKPLSAQARVEALEAEWRGQVWKCDGGSVRDVPELWEGWPEEDLERPTATSARAAANTFPIGTGLGADQWHPRHFALLSNRALEAWIDIMTYAETVGHVPVVFQLLMVVFIPKAEAGVRPIGLFTSSLRLWGRLRRAVAVKWEAQNDRPYFWGGQGPLGSDVCLEAGACCGVLPSVGAAGRYGSV